MKTLSLAIWGKLFWHLHFSWYTHFFLHLESCFFHICSLWLLFCLPIAVSVLLLFYTHKHCSSNFKKSKCAERHTLASCAPPLWGMCPPLWSSSSARSSGRWRTAGRNGRGAKGWEKRKAVVVVGPVPEQRPPLRWQQTEHWGGGGWVGGLWWGNRLGSSSAGGDKDKGMVIRRKQVGLAFWPYTQFIHAVGKWIGRMGGH